MDSSILQKIKHGEVSMKPKFIFYAAQTLLILGIVTLFLISAWFANILFYKFQTHQVWKYLSYGEPGIAAFWLNIPLGALILSILTFLGGIFLFKRFDICYKKSYRLMIFAFALIIFLMALLIERNEVNKILDQEKSLSVLYHNQIINTDWLVATVIHRDPKGYYVRNFDGRFFRAVPITSKTKLPIMNRTDCIKIKGIITDNYTIKTYSLYKCPYKISP